MTSTQSEARRRMYRRRRITAGAAAGLVVLALAAGGYVWAAAAAPLPDLQPTLDVSAELQFDADQSAAQAVVDQQFEPTAIGWAHDDEVWSNDDTSYSLASVSKLLTVLVALEAQPLEPGADGPTYVWTAEDQQRQNDFLAMQGVAYPITVGTEITLRQMLQFIFLPSSNDYAEAYAYRVFGDNETFLEAVEQFTEKHGLHSMTLVEPTGMDMRNQSNAADLVRLARLAIDNPTVREFNGMKYAEMPWGIGTLENTNPLLGEMPGVIGVKTGALLGYNLIVAQEFDALGREVINIAVTLDRDSKEARAESGWVMLNDMATLPQHHELVAEGERIGTVTTWLGDEVPIVTAGAADTVLLPGEEAVRTHELGTIAPGPTGSRVGEVTLSAPSGSTEIALVTTEPIEEPDLWWRLTHPATVFAW